jgi:phage pi2 protein 07
VVNSMLNVQLDEKVIEERFLEELKKRLDHIEQSHVFWDAKELKRRTCMSWNTIQDTFFHDERFQKVKAKVGGKWYFAAKETEEFLLMWIKEQSATNETTKVVGL